MKGVGSPERKLLDGLLFEGSWRCVRMLYATLPCRHRFGLGWGLCHIDIFLVGGKRICVFSPRRNSTVMKKTSIRLPSVEIFANRILHLWGERCAKRCTGDLPKPSLRNPYHQT